MKVTSKKTDDLNQVLTVNVAADDYMAARKKKLAELQRRAEVPGFRKGKVPASLIEKWYGENALGDVVNTVVGDALQNYIKDKKLDIIGEPLPVEEKNEQEWKAGNDFVFKFDIALTPKLNLTLEKTDEVLSYNINVTETEKKKLAEVYKKQQEGAEKPLTDEEIAKQVEGQLTMEYKQASEFRLEKDVRDYCVKKADIQLPEKFLRRWLIAANEGKFTPEQIDKDFDGFLADYRWQLVMAALSEQFNIKVEESDLTEEAKNFAKYQYAMYGIANPPEDAIEGLVKNMLQDQSNLQRMAENVQARKVIAAIKEKITVKAKKISADKFRELK